MPAPRTGEKTNIKRGESILWCQEARENQKVQGRGPERSWGQSQRVHDPNWNNSGNNIN